VYIDRLLDSSLPHNLIQEYNMQSYGYAPDTSIHVPDTISEEFRRNDSLASHTSSNGGTPQSGNTMTQGTRIERTPRNLYKLPDERTPLICVQDEDDDEDSQQNVMPPWTPEEEADSNDRIVTVAIYLNLAANTILLVLKVVAMVLTSSVSVLAALVDAVLDFLSTAIVWTTTRLISTEDQYKYPVGRRRLEPIGVLVFSVIMITSFFQVALEGFNRLSHGEHVAVSLGPAAILIMAGTVVIKGACWIWCRLIKNSSVQALAQDAQTDVVFNTFSIIFPLVGYYADIWFLDSLGGILLSVYVIYAWSRTTAVHVCNLSGAAATADERNVLLYLTMRFAKTIKHIQGLQAYHAGDKLNVEVDIVVDGNMRLRDSHDLGESLQYVLESVPTVDRAFVHMDYTAFNLPTHMRQ
jgi:cation diffusion facilitator family transporter